MDTTSFASTIEYREKLGLSHIERRKRFGGPSCVSFGGDEYWHETLAVGVQAWPMREKDRLRAILNNGQVVVITLTGIPCVVIGRATNMKDDLTLDIIRAVNYR